MRYAVLNRNYASLGLSGLLLTLCTGCPAISSFPAPGQMATQRDPSFGRAYHLYVPTTYRDDQKWPLVVTCHGTRPFDTAPLEMEEWKGVAEKRGFLLLAPELTATSAVAPAPQQQIERQIDDERAILSMLCAVRCCRSVDENRIFITGWSAGGYDVLFVGLRHPEIFRAVAVRQGNFNPAYVEPCIPFLDRNQPIQVTYGRFDLLRDDALKCLDWLRNHDMEPSAVERDIAHRRDLDPVYNFFVDVIRNRPWLRIEVREDPADDMRMTFSTRASFAAAKVLWDFGDGQRSGEASSSHRYANPGLYTVKVAAWPGGGDPHVRQVQLQVPRTRLGAARPATAPAR